MVASSGLTTCKTCAHVNTTEHWVTGVRQSCGESTCTSAEQCPSLLRGQTVAPANVTLFQKPQIEKLTLSSQARWERTLRRRKTGLTNKCCCGNERCEKTSVLRCSDTSLVCMWGFFFEQKTQRRGRWPRRRQSRQRDEANDESDKGDAKTVDDTATGKSTTRRRRTLRASDKPVITCWCDLCVLDARMPHKFKRNPGNTC